MFVGVAVAVEESLSVGLEVDRGAEADVQPVRSIPMTRITKPVIKLLIFKLFLHKPIPDYQQGGL